MALASPAYAQAVSSPDSLATSSAQAPAEAGVRNEDIVVTAQFRSQNLQNTPLAITAVNSALLEARGQTSIYQVAAQAPNVTLQPAGQSYGSGVVAFIRGIGQYDNSYALEPGVGTYVDDVYYSTLTGSLLDLMDLDRVEILRGPQGTLAGKNSIGGAIKLYSKKPTGDNRGMVQATYGSFNRTELRGFADLTIVPDKLFVRIAGAGKSEDGYITRLDYGNTHPGSGVPTFSNGPRNKLGTLGGTSYTAGRIALRWVATPDIDVNVAGDYTSDKSESGAAVTVRAADPAVNSAGQPFVVNTITGAGIPFDCRFVAYGPNSCDTLAGYNRKYVSYSTFLDGSAPTTQSPYKPFATDPISHLNAFGLQGTIDWRLADGVNLKSITGYRHYQNLYGTDEDGSPIPISLIVYNLKHSQFSQEVRLNTDLLGGKLQTTIGGYYFKSHSSTGARVDLTYSLLDFLNGPDKIDVTSKAAFGQATLHVTDALNVTGGVRYTIDQKDYLYRRSNPDESAVQPCTGFNPFAADQPSNCAIFGLDGVIDTAKSKRFDYRAAVDYRFSPALLAYAQFSTGFKGGGVNPYPFFGPAAGPLNQVKAFGPESLKSFEIGLKTDLFDRRVRLNGAAFYNKYDDIILAISDCSGPGLPCNQPNNIGRADVKGFELEGQFYPVDGLSVDGSFSYIDFQYKKINGSTDITLDDVTPYTPKYKWSAGVQYEYDIGPGAITARIDGSYQSSIFTAPHNVSVTEITVSGINSPNKIESYFLGNGRLSYRASDANWEIALEVRNITDKYYYRTMINNAYGDSAGPGMPRTWAVTVKRNF